MTPAQKTQQTAYNEFIADYVERHGECKATRNEAHDVADWVVKMVGEVALLCRKYAELRAVASDAANDLAATFVDDNADIYGKDEAKFLAACSVQAVFA